MVHPTAAAAVIPFTPGRPAVVTKFVYGVKTTFFVSMRDAAFWDTRRRLTRGKASTHPDIGGSTSRNSEAFRQAAKRYQAWYAKETAWYKFLGLETPDKARPTPDGIDGGVLTELLLLLAESRVDSVALRVRALRLVRPSFTREDILRLVANTSTRHSARVMAEWRTRRSPQRKRGMQRVLETLVNGQITLDAIAFQTNLSRHTVQQYVTRLRDRGLNIVAVYNGQMAYCLLGLNETGKARLQQLTQEKAA